MSIFYVEHWFFFGQTKVQEALVLGGLQHNFLIFDGKKHPKNFWFHGF